MTADPGMASQPEPGPVADGQPETGLPGPPHQHEFPANPPGGSYLYPGPCSCGKTFEQGRADTRLAAALAAIEHAYGVPPRVDERWAVAFGSDSLNDGKGCVEHYDDEEDARDHVRYYEGGRVVRRTVIALRWETVPDGSGDKEASHRDH